MRSKYFFISTLILGSIAFVGLLIAQTRWFDAAYRLKENQFNDKTLVLLNQVGMAINTKPSTSLALNSYLESISTDDTPLILVDTSKLKLEIREIMDSVFLSNGVLIPFTYSMYFSSSCEERLKILRDQVANSKTDSSGGTNQPIACLLSDGQIPYYLDIDFPQKEKYIFRQSSGLLSISVLFILLLITSFAAMVSLFFRQKKISSIKNDFINNLTHEFKTPVASISLASKIVQKSKDRKIGEEEMKCLQMITSESKRLENNIDKILQIASVDAGNFALKLEKADLHQLISKVVSDFHLLLKEKQGSIQLKLGAANAVVFGDPVHLRNMFFNLIDNAIKYSHSAPEVEISIAGTENELTCKIKDYGIGMRDEVQSQIFKKFYRATNGEDVEAEGFGLGLSYVKSIVHAHRGKIHFQSEPGQGTEFIVTLPRKQ